MRDIVNVNLFVATCKKVSTDVKRKYNFSVYPITSNKLHFAKLNDLVWLSPLSSAFPWLGLFDEVLNMLRARKVLCDVEAIHALLEAEEDLVKFRVLWVSAVTLVRAVGHVLYKIDGKRSNSLKRSIRNFFGECRKSPEANKIYFEFIKKERDLILKEYEFRYSSTPELLAEHVGKMESYRPDDCIFCPIVDGLYVNEDCRDVLEMAILWWHSKLDAIEINASQSGDQTEIN